MNLFLIISIYLRFSQNLDFWTWTLALHYDLPWSFFLCQGWVFLFSPLTGGNWLPYTEDHAQDWKTEQSQSLASCQTQPTSAPKASPLLSWFSPEHLIGALFKWLLPAYPCCCFWTPLPPQLLPYMLPNLVNVILCHCCLLCSVPHEGSHWRCSPSPKISMQAHGSGRRLHSLWLGILCIHMEGGLNTAIP